MNITSDGGGLPYTRQQMMLLNELFDLEVMDTAEIERLYGTDDKAEAKTFIIEYWT